MKVMKASDDLYHVFQQRPPFAMQIVSGSTDTLYRGLEAFLIPNSLNSVIYPKSLHFCFPFMAESQGWFLSESNHFIPSASVRP